MKFAHLSDVHLGSWKQPEMQELNFDSFRKALDIIIKERLDFVLISGDLFDNAYPPIEILKRTFAEFRRLHDAKIPCFLIAGSHDYSVSGKTFLDVLEHAGFCKNVESYEERENEIYLNPVLYKGVAIYGYPGKKSGLEIPDLRKTKLHEAPGLYKIFMLHTTIDKAKGNIPVDALESDNLPKADYYALGHLHIHFEYENLVYPGPVFPNNFAELEDLQQGSFYIVDTNSNSRVQINISSKEIVPIKVNVKDAVTATEKILSEFEKRNLQDKIVLLRLSGELEHGKISDIQFTKIENIAKEKGAYFLLKNTHELKTKQTEIPEIMELSNKENIEEETVKICSQADPSDLNELIPQLINSLAIEKEEGEKSDIFNRRVIEEARRILKF